MIWTRLMDFILPYFRSAKLLIGLGVLAIGYILYTQYTFMSLKIESLEKDKVSYSVKIKELELDLSKRTKEYEATIDSLQTTIKQKAQIQTKYQNISKELNKALQGSSDECLKAEVPQDIRDIIRRGR